MEQKPTQDFSPMFLLALGMGGGTEAISEGVSAIGKRDLVQCSVLPKCRDKDRAALEAAGVKFLGPVEGDALFEEVELPPGWTKKPTGHELWTHLLDEMGRRRAEIMYSAVPWDRDAALHACRRYNIDIDYEIPGSGGASQRRVMDPVAACAVIKDGYLTEIHRTAKIDSDPEAPYRVSSAVRELAEAWLNANYPGWDDPAAYWNNL